MVKILLFMFFISVSFFSYPHESHTGSGSSEGVQKIKLVRICTAWLWKSETESGGDYFIHIHHQRHQTIQISEERYRLLLQRPNSSIACSYCSGCEVSR